MKIVVNGGGVAGPTIAYWLLRSGHEVLLVEEAPQLRKGGYIIDFWGAGYDVAEKMGLIPRIREVGYQVTEVRFVDARGERAGGFSSKVFTDVTKGRFTSLRRSDLAAMIYEALDGRVETILGDSVAGIEDEGDHVRVFFDHAAPQRVDLVIGADGLHSRVRRLAFHGAEVRELSLGYHVAAFEVEGYRPRDELVYVSHSVPGKQISRFALRDDKTLFLFIFHDEHWPEEFSSDAEDTKSVLAKVFSNVGWECPKILDAMQSVGAFYFDRVSQIRMGRWTNGRAALVGDAAACVSLLAGEGASLAMAEAYILAGELRAWREDYVTAFDRYQEKMRPFVMHKQESAMKFGSSLVPKTALGLRFRDMVTSLLHIPFIADSFIGHDLRDDIELPDYGF